MIFRSRQAFTLLECIAALALFAFVAVAVSQTCFNCLNSVNKIKKDAYKDSLKDYIRKKILSQTSLETIRSGFEIYDPEGNSVTIKGEAIPTRILDLFILTAECEDLHYRENFHLFRPDWYSQLETHTIERDELLEDRTEDLQDLRKEIAK